MYYNNNNNTVVLLKVEGDGVWYAMIIYEHEKRKSNDE